VPFSVESWWAFLVALAGVNLVIWGLSAASLARQRGTLDADGYTFRRRQLVLSALYVFGCGFRCVLPVYDIPRICLVDTWLASVLVGRTVATVAELAFAAQWALLLRECGRATGNKVVSSISNLVFPLIVIAEICSWTAVLTTANLGHVFENSLWGVTAALIVASLLAMSPRWPRRERPMLAT